MKTPVNRMITEIKTSIQAVEASYSVVRIGKCFFVIQSAFVIAKVKMLSERKFTVKPFNILGKLNIYLMLGKYHLHYKILEDDVIYAVKQSSGFKNISIVFD